MYIYITQSTSRERLDFGDRMYASVGLGTKRLNIYLRCLAHNLKFRKRVCVYIELYVYASRKVPPASVLIFGLTLEDGVDAPSSFGPERLCIY